jgi:integrase/recombinase XerC
MRSPAQTDPGPIASDLIAEMQRWLSHLGSERRLSPKTLEAYERDLRQCLTFLSAHLGKKISLSVFSKLAPADVRAFMAMRRGDGVASRSLMRALAGLRSFAKFLERARRRSARRCPSRCTSSARAASPMPICAPAKIASRGYLRATPP